MIFINVIKNFMIIIRYKINVYNISSHKYKGCLIKTLLNLFKEEYHYLEI